LRAYPQVYEEYDHNVIIVGGAAWLPRDGRAGEFRANEKAE
jgi:hypothetical protein